MAKRLVSAGHEVHMITSVRDGSKTGWSSESLAGIQVHWHSTPYSNHFSYLRRIFAFLTFALAAARRVRRLGGDLVFATSTPLTIAIPAVWASRRLCVPMVFEVRDLWPQLPIAMGAIKNPVLQWLAKHLELFAYRNASQIIALSPDMAEGVVNAGYPRSRVTIVPNNCNIDHFQGQLADAEKVLAGHHNLRGKQIVLYAGTLGKLNGVSYLVSIALQMLNRDESIAFLVIGDGKERQQIECYAKNSGVLGKNFWMLPPIAKEEIPAFFAVASLGCSLVVNLPETWGNSANKFFDTLAAARPVMINHLGWQAEEIENSDIGIVVPPDQPEVAAEMIRHFLQDESRLLNAGEAARQLALTKFNTDKLFMDFKAVLEKARTKVD